MKKVILWTLTLSWAYLIFYLTSIPNFKVSNDTLTSLLISNGGHFIFFGVQAILLYFTLNRRYTAIALTSLYGVIDELHQISVPGRAADPLDWLLDTLGAIIFLAVLIKIKSNSAQSDR